MTQRTRIVSDKEFKELAKANDAGDVALRKGWTCDEVKTIDIDNRRIDFIISTDAVDRMGDTVSVEGWDLKAFKKNPVVLFGHDHSSPPVGKALRVKVEEVRKGKLALVSQAEFMSQEISPFAFSIFQMFVEGFMKATSVGFIPMEFQFTEDQEKRPFGIDFTKQELIEFSTVPVPANPEALVDARSKGIDTAPFKRWAEDTLDDYETHEKSGLVLQRKTLEQLRKHADPTAKTSVHVSKADSDRILKENLRRLREQKEQTETREKEMQMYKHAITWNAAHPNGTQKASASESVDTLSAQGDESLLAISAWRDESGEKTAYDLIHHTKDGQHYVVYDALVECAAKLPFLGLEVSEESAIKDHLGYHYQEFDEDAPWERDDGMWDTYENAVTAKSAEVANETLKELAPDLDVDEFLKEMGLEAEAIVEEEEIVEEETDVSDVVEGDVVDEGESRENTDDADEDEEEFDTIDGEEALLAQEEEDEYEELAVLMMADAVSCFIDISDEILDGPNLEELNNLKSNKAGQRAIKGAIENAEEIARLLKSVINQPVEVATEDDFDIEYDDDAETRDVGTEDTIEIEVDEEELANMMKDVLPDVLKDLTAMLKGKVD